MNGGASVWQPYTFCNENPIQFNEYLHLPQNKTI